MFLAQKYSNKHMMLLIFAVFFGIISKKCASNILFDAHFLFAFTAVFRGGSSYPPCVQARNERSD